MQRLQQTAACNLLLWMYALNRMCAHMGPTMKSLDKVETDLSACVCVLPTRRTRRRRQSSVTSNPAGHVGMPSHADLSAYDELDKVSNARAFITNMDGADIRPIISYAVELFKTLVLLYVIRLL